MITKLKNGFYVASMALGPINTNIHILYNNGVALIIDAPLDSLEFVQHFLKQQQLEPLALLLTHGHWDHMAGAAAMKQALQIETWGSRNDSLLFQSPDIMSAFAGSLSFEPVGIDHFLDIEFDAKLENQLSLQHSIGIMEFEVYAMPGHTAGGVAFYFPKAACVMAGDQLFRGSVGRSDFPGGDFELLAASIRQSLYCLPRKTIVFTGHGEQTTIDYEIRYNPFVSF